MTPPRCMTAPPAFCGITALSLSRKGWPPLRHGSTSCLQAEIRPYSAPAHKPSTQDQHPDQNETTDATSQPPMGQTAKSPDVPPRWLAPPRWRKSVTYPKQWSNKQDKEARASGQIKNKIPPGANPSFRSKMKATHPSPKHRPSPSPQTVHLR